MYILRNKYNACIGTEEGPQERKSEHRLVQGVGKKMQLKGLADRQINGHKVCFKAPEIVMENMNEALVSDGVDSESMTALAKEFEGMVFLGLGQVLVE